MIDTTEDGFVNQALGLVDAAHTVVSDFQSRCAARQQAVKDGRAGAVQVQEQLRSELVAEVDRITKAESGLELLQRELARRQAAVAFKPADVNDAAFATYATFMWTHMLTFDVVTLELQLVAPSIDAGDEITFRAVLAAPRWVLDSHAAPALERAKELRFAIGHAAAALQGASEALYAAANVPPPPELVGIGNAA